MEQAMLNESSDYSKEYCEHGAVNIDSLRQRLTPAALAPRPTEGINGTGALDAADVDLLILNLDASQHVHSRAHFFSWTQGLLQGLIQHEALICAVRDDGERAGSAGRPQGGLHVETCSTRVPDGGVFSAPVRDDIALLPRLVDAWKAAHHAALALPLRPCGLFGSGELVLQLDRISATQVGLHGCHDSRGEATSLFLFCCREGTLAVRELTLLRLLTPFVHEAWMRVLMTAAQTNRHGLTAAAPGHGHITQREQEILHWIYLGKSNNEIGQILSISPLTVKNHVQKVLHKLDVVNRAQAVGKALDAHLIHM
jgi:transcriptional regulator EpsA